MQKRIYIAWTLIIIGFLFCGSIRDFCIGDQILWHIGLPAWSNRAESSGIHYTIYYALIFFFFPAFFIMHIQKEATSCAGRAVELVSGIVLFGMIIMSILWIGWYAVS